MANGSIGPFRPAGTIALTAGTTATAAALAGFGQSVLVTNAGTVTVFVSFGVAGQVPAATVPGALPGSIPVLPGTAALFDLGTVATATPFGVSVVTASAAAAVYVSIGDGSTH